MTQVFAAVVYYPAVGVRTEASSNVTGQNNWVTTICTEPREGAGYCSEISWQPSTMFIRSARVKCRSYNVRCVQEFTFNDGGTVAGRFNDKDHMGCLYGGKTMVSGLIN